MTIETLPSEVTLTLDGQDVLVPIHPYAPLQWTIQTPGGPPPLKLFTDPEYVDPQWVIFAAAAPWNFFEMCRGISDDDVPVQFEARPQQRYALEMMHHFRWTMVNKYRQAKMSTVVALGCLLRDCMIFSGMNGLLVAETHETAKDLFRRILYAYENLPDGLRVKLKQRTKGSETKLEFVHGGSIQVVSGSAWSPGVGRSPGRLMFTEIGEIPPSLQAACTNNLFPGIARRPNGRVWIESTPGPAGCTYHTFWANSLENKGRFADYNDGAPIFLEWWLDDSCRAQHVPDDFQRTPEEIHYIKRLQGLPNGRSKNPTKEITDAHLQFRRDAIATECSGSARLFDAKYPPSPTAGWLGSHNPVLPEEELEILYNSALSEADGQKILEAGGLTFLPDWHPNVCAVYLISADPKRDGTGGDPAAITVWETFGPEYPLVEVGTGEFPHDDGPMLADRILAIHDWIDENKTWQGYPEQHRFSKKDIRWDQLRPVSAGDTPLAIVESNIGTTIATLHNFDDYLHIDTYNSGSSQPGFFMSGRILRLANSHAAKGIRDGWLVPSFRSTIRQMQAFDGTKKEARVRNEDGTKHHFDRVRTVVMAAYVFAEYDFMYPKFRTILDQEDEDYLDDFAQLPKELRDLSSWGKRDIYDPRTRR